ncbi:MAG: acyl-[acyl-carrier-protein]--UDP-N-acetylglucosamine O-acyltransferase [Candidatus Goldiibacteriota bacterium HGW-Goldbacteria-1]|jgi:UDP-N-acetylglucosamine acyltransferase|nr:MAG: acyl-[acyl-carrier-protein]--UDP-N-acetylglucosamine O-acyltransferase [Candidatus Goldiibacteriota bacterium HGW-Goldbacteria-1]
MIHTSAIVSNKARIGANVKIGPFAIIDDDVEIGDSCEIGPKAHIVNGARLGNNNFIGEGTIISDNPQDLKYKGEKSLTVIGNNNVIREYVTVHKATAEGKETRIGNDCFIMSMAHVAHDCKIGNNVIIVNYAGLTGHVEVGDFAFVSGLTAVHQNVRIGAHSMVGGGVRVTKDVMPFVMVSESPLQVFGLNKVGLKRRGFTKQQLEALESAYHILFREKMMLAEALKKIESEVPMTAEVKLFVEFARNSKRGLTR